MSFSRFEAPQKKEIQMPLTTCRECGKEVSSEAETCPHCGIAKKKVPGRPSNAGFLSGIFGCLFAVLGIFTLGLVFLPFAVLFTFISLLRSMFGLSASGFCAAMGSGILTVVGFIVSPTTWLALAALAGVSTHQQGQVPADSLMQTPVAGSALKSE